MQAAPHSAVGARLEPTEPLAETHRLADPDVGGDRFVGGTQPGLMRDDDDPSPGEHPGKTDHTGRGSQHRVIDLGREIDPTVPGQPGLARWRELADHHRRPHRPAGGVSCGRDGGRAADDGRDGGHQEQQAGGMRHGPESASTRPRRGTLPEAMGTGTGPPALGMGAFRVRPRAAYTGRARPLRSR